MKNAVVIFTFIFGILLFGCKPEPAAHLVIEIYNSSSANILVQRNILSHSDTLFILVPIEGFFSVSRSAMDHASRNKKMRKGYFLFMPPVFTVDHYNCSIGHLKLNRS